MIVAAISDTTEETMFAAERKRIIKSYLLENEKVEVVKISEILNVSEVTVRRDLEKLENEGFLIRTHGGAILNDRLECETAVEVSQSVDEYESEIVETASAMIHDDDVIMMSSGPINRLLAKKLGGRQNVTVLTNDLIVALNAASNPSNRVICLGGNLDQDRGYVTGTLTLKNLRQYHVNRFFWEVDAISETLDLYVSSQPKAELIEEANGCADMSILLCKYSLFGTKAFMRLGPITMTRSIITNPLLSDEYKIAIYNSNIVLYTSINAFEGNV